jgi:hypothetical protein
MGFSTQVQVINSDNKLTNIMNQINNCIVKYYDNNSADMANRSKNNIDVAIDCARNGQVNQCKKLANNVKKNLLSITSYIPDIYRNHMNDITLKELRYIAKNIIHTFLYYWIVKNTIQLARRQNMIDEINARNQQNFIYY